MRQRLILSLGVSVLLAGPSVVRAQMPVVPSLTVDQTRHPVFEGGKRETGPLSNFRLHLDYEMPTGGVAALQVREGVEISLPAGAKSLDLTYEHVPGHAAAVFAFLDGVPLYENPAVEGSAAEHWFESTVDEAKEVYKFGGDYTMALEFRATGDGTLVAKCEPDGKWGDGAKGLIIRDGELLYAVAGAADIGPPDKITDGKTHRVVLVAKGEQIELFVDGRRREKRGGMQAPDGAGHVLRVGRATDDFGGDLSGVVEQLLYWNRALDGKELGALAAGRVGEVNTPDLNWSPDPPKETFGGAGLGGWPSVVKLVADSGFTVKNAWVQQLEMAGHARLLGALNGDSLEEGKKIYESLCATCHGTPEKEGSLPTALKFHEGEFKNGSDPYRMFQTLTKGYGMMVPQPQYTAAQKHAVIHYIRETFLKAHNPSQYVPAGDDYLASLPLAMTSVTEAPPVRQTDGRKYEQMDFGPYLMWTYQVGEGPGGAGPNIAQKGIAVRLDPGEGGVSKGKAWVIYDHDLMRVATAYTGDFVDWRGIAFDGSHGTHTSTAGEPLLVMPNAPAWEHPVGKSWKDERITGRDGRRYGPLPREWVHYKGLYRHGGDVAVSYTVGKAAVLEKPSLISYGATPVLIRTLQVGKSPHDLVTRVSPKDGPRVAIKAAEGVELVADGDGMLMRIPAESTPSQVAVLVSRTDQETLDAFARAQKPVDFDALTGGGPSQFPEVLVTAGSRGGDEAAFAVDTFTMPEGDANPWHSWMRLGGFDFFPDNPDRAAVCTWLGDVWLVDGISGAPDELKWRRICSGLFQPLGLKIVNGKILVTCRDQIARLHDLNGDEEIDFVESFNNDHQVTEHFHEFAMGLQADQTGNLYYAKSARHAKTALVPHHGTLLRVSADGTRTDIVANGFRAANGVCINPDGTWIVTDQEGHWNPKNRINYVKEGGFYGNMFGYHDVTDDSDEAMEQPLCWITNHFDRSPAELLWVPEDAKWGALNGVLLNTSYGNGQIYTVPHEVIDGQAQGGMCALPIPLFSTGVMRGRFHPVDGQLYTIGMYAWAGNRRADGGFFRIRATGKPAMQPIGLKAAGTRVRITFSDPLASPEAEGIANYAVKTWGLKRTANYGSQHYDEKSLPVRKAVLSPDGRTVTLTIPDLHPTWGMEIRCKLTGASGVTAERVIHNSIHDLRSN